MMAELREELPRIQEPSDDELIERSCGGDGDAYGVLISKYQRKIYKVALAILRDETKAETVTHDSFVQAYLNLARFQKRAEFQTWVTRIAINRSRDELRERKWLSFSIDDERENENVVRFEPADPRPDAERNVLSGEMQKVIDRAVEGLSAQQKIIFRLRHFEEMSLESIAESLGLRSGTVRAHLFRAVHKVRDALRGAGLVRETGDDDEALQ